MCRLVKPKSNLSNLYPPTKGYFRETCKSENINLISPTPMFNLGIIKIIVKSLSTIVVLSLIKIYLSEHYQYLTFQPDPKVRSMLMVKGFASMYIYTSFHFI